MTKCTQCKKECKKTIIYNNKPFCCDVCLGKYKKKHKPQICEFC